MKSLSPTASVITLAAALALSACNQAPTTTDNVQVAPENAADFNDAAFNDSSALIEDASDDPAAVTVAAVPKPAGGVSTPESAPLDDAAEIESDIRDGRGIERVRYGDGWAWTRGGKILRTADRDGHNPSYFRPGDDRPFFVQRGDRSYAYQGDKPVRSFDRNGRAEAPDGDRAREAAEAAREAREQREHAERAREHAQRPDRGPRPGASPTPSPSATPDRPGRDRDDRGPRGDRGGDRADPTPAPSATPTWRRPDRQPERRPERSPGDRTPQRED
jgi:hypothetical protein